MPSSTLFRQAVLSQMRIVSPSTATYSQPSGESAPVRKQKRPSCATSNKLNKERGQQKQEQASSAPAAPALASVSSKSHIILSMSKLFGRSRDEPARGRSRQRRAVSGGSVGDTERRRARSPSTGSSARHIAPIPRAKLAKKLSTKAAHAPANGYKAVRSYPFAVIDAVQVGKSILPVNTRQTPSIPSVDTAPGSSLPVAKAKRGPSPLSQSSWMMPEEPICSTPAPVDISPTVVAAAEPVDNIAMDWEPTLPLPPLTTRSLSSTTSSSSSSSSVPTTPIDEDVVMIDVFDADNSTESDSVPLIEDRLAKPEGCQPLQSRTIKPLPVRRNPHVPITAHIPLPVAADDNAHSLVASDSELERQLWADMNDILGHAEEPAEFCCPQQEIPSIMSLPAGVPPPIIASTFADMFPPQVSKQVAGDILDIVVTPATPVITSQADVHAAQSLHALWEELFGPEIDA